MSDEFTAERARAILRVVRDARRFGLNCRDAGYVERLEAENERLREALNEIIAEGYDGDFAVEAARNALGVASSREEASS